LVLGVIIATDKRALQHQCDRHTESLIIFLFVKCEMSGWISLK
jgi:hypothetical protein